MTGEIISEVKIRKTIFSSSIIADEARDCSNKEEMSLVLRFDNNCDIREDFIRFVHCDEGKVKSSTDRVSTSVTMNSKEGINKDEALDDVSLLDLRSTLNSSLQMQKLLTYKFLQICLNHKSSLPILSYKHQLINFFRI